MSVRLKPLFFVFLLTACAPSADKGFAPPPGATLLSYKTSDGGSCVEVADDPRAEKLAAEDKYRTMTNVPAGEEEAYLADRTTVSFMPGHGTQISYTAADGTSHLWYPGNARVLHGRWKIDRQKRYVRECYNYGSGSRNPVTGHSGPGFECGTFQQGTFLTVDSQKGDPFGLQQASLVTKTLTKEAVRPYIPGCMPFKKPYLKDGKTPIEHLLADYGKQS